MKVLLILLLFTCSAHAKPLQCVLWPHSAGCRPALAPLPPVKPVATERVRPMPTAKPAPQRIKSNFAKQHKQAKRAAAKQKVVLPWWCPRIPAGSTMGQVEAAAPIFIGRRMTATERQQAQACLASKS